VTSDELEQELVRAYSEDFLRACLKAVFTARRLAWEDCRQRFAATEADNTRPFLARGYLEGFLRDVASRFPGLEPRVERASNWHHTEIHSGKLAMTQNSVAAPCALIDTSDYRMTLARSNQGVLEIFSDDIHAPADASLLVLLLHSQSRHPDSEDQERYGYLAGSAYLAFPASDLKGYLHTINLFDRFPEVVADNVPKEWDEEARLRFVRRARRTEAA